MTAKALSAVPATPAREPTAADLDAILRAILSPRWPVELDRRIQNMADCDRGRTHQCLRISNRGDVVEKPRGLLLLMNDVPAEHEDEFNRWYTEEHLPERAAAWIHLGSALSRRRRRLRSISPSTSLRTSTSSPSERCTRYDRAADALDNAEFAAAELPPPQYLRGDHAPFGEAISHRAGQRTSSGIALGAWTGPSLARAGTLIARGRRDTATPGWFQLHSCSLASRAPSAMAASFR